MEQGEGAIRLPKASRWPTCKPLKTIAKHDFTSKRPLPLEGCEADCILAPKRGNESALRPLLLILIFHRNHRLRRLLGRRRLSQARNLSDMKRAVGAVGPEQPDPVDRTHRHDFESQLDQVAGIKESVGEPEHCDQREGQENWQRIGLAQEDPDGNADLLFQMEWQEHNTSKAERNGGSEGVADNSERGDERDAEDNVGDALDQSDYRYGLMFAEAEGCVCRGGSGWR
jgi:hypothetical protein